MYGQAFALALLSAGGTLAAPQMCACTSSDAAISAQGSSAAAYGSAPVTTVEVTVTQTVQQTQTETITQTVQQGQTQTQTITSFLSSNGAPAPVQTVSCANSKLIEP